MYGIIYSFLSALTLYFLLYPLTNKIRGKKKVVLKFSLMPLFLIGFSYLFELSGFLTFHYRDALVFFSLYIFIFFFFYSIILIVKEKETSWKEVIILGLAVSVVAFLHRAGFLIPVLSFLKKPITEVGETEIDILDIVIAATIFYLSVKYSKVLEAFVKRKLQRISSMDKARSSILSLMVRYGLVIVGVLVAFSLVGIDFTTLQVLIGALGVGIGFGLRDIINNLISGFILLSDQSIVPGDMIEIDGLLGKVTIVGIRTSKIKTMDNVEVIVPNSNLVNDRVINYTHTDRLIRIQIAVGVSYSSDPPKIRDLLMDGLGDIEGVLDEPGRYVFFSEFGDSSLNFDITLWTDDPGLKRRIASEVRYKVWEIFKKNNIEIPFPQVDVHMKGESGGEN